MRGARAGLSSSPGLGAWVGLPLAALIALLLAITALPGSDCEGTSGGTSAAELLVAAVACLASVCCIAAASYRLGKLLFGVERVSSLSAVLAASFVGLGFVLGAAYDPGSGVTVFGQVLIAGTAATAVLFVGLAVAVIARRTVHDVGFWLPLYLLGAALFVYPIFAVLALAVSRGAFC